MAKNNRGCPGQPKSKRTRSKISDSLKTYFADLREAKAIADQIRRNGVGVVVAPPAGGAK